MLALATPAATCAANATRPSGSDDRTLVAALRQGQPHAFKEVYARHADTVYTFLIRLTGYGPDADDLFQETWLQLAEHAPKLQADTRLVAWLLTVARNRWHSQHRRRSVVDRYSLRHRHQYRLEGTTDQPDAAFEGAVIRARLLVAIGKLAAKYREVLVLMAESDLSKQEMAQVLGIRDDNLRQRIRRARELLKKELEQKELAQLETKP